VFAKKKRNPLKRGIGKFFPSVLPEKNFSKPRFQKFFSDIITFLGWERHFLRKFGFLA